MGWRVAGAVAALCFLYRFMNYILLAASVVFLAWQAIAHAKASETKT